MAKFDNENHSALDAAPLGPEGVVADSCAPEGTTVNVLTRPTDKSWKIIVPIAADQVACPVCEDKGIHLFFMTLSDMGKHFHEHHTDARIHWP
jgi:hypothetical protein